MNIEKVFTYEEKDVITYGFDVLRYKRGPYWIVIIPVMVLLISTSIYSAGRIEQLDAIMLILFAAILILTPTLTYLQMRKSYRTSSFMKEAHSYTFTEDGLTVTSSNGNGKFTWNQFYRIALFKNSLALYTNARSASIYPRRIFTNEEIDELVGLFLSSEELKKKTKIYKRYV